MRFGSVDLFMEFGDWKSRMGRPLANALLKLEEYNKQMPMQVNPATAQMYIVNPLSGQSLMRLFSTHPPIEERVARLMAMKPGDLMK